MIVNVHFTGGHKQATKISKLIQTCTNRVKKLLTEYSALQHALNDDCSDISIKDACDLQSPFWNSEHSYSSSESHQRIPASRKQRLIDLNYLKQRACEEKQLVISDLTRIVESYSEHVKLCICSILNLLEEYDIRAAMFRNETKPDQFLPRFLSFASEHLPLLPRRVSGSISALLITCREKHSNMIRAQDVLKVIVGMY